MAFKIATVLIIGFLSNIESSSHSHKNVTLKTFTLQDLNQPKDLKTFSLEEVIPLRADLYPERLSMQWISDKEYIYKEAGIGLRKYNALTDVFSTIISDDELYELSSNYSISTFSDDGKYLLLTRNMQKVYRYSTMAEYYVYDLETKSILNLSRGPLQVVVWGSNHSLAYVQNNNVFYVPDATKTDVVATLTVDGVPGEVYYGATDWIYEEEIFNAAEALWFSPKGTFLAVPSFNDTNVESAIYPYYGDPFDVHNQYPEMVHFKYPKAGRTNPDVGLRVYKLDELHSEPWTIPAPVAVVGIDHILGSVNWASDNNLVVLWLNRRQNVGILVDCDLKKDKCSIVNEQSEHNGWIDINQPWFDDSGRKMVDIQPLFNGEQRFLHAARYNFDTRTTEDLSPGNSTVTEILGWNQETDTVYFTVAPGHLPWLRQVWATSGGVVRCISCKEPTCRYASSTFSPGAKYAVMTCSACNIPPRVLLYNAEEDSFKLIKDNRKLSDKLTQYKLPMTLFNVLTIADDVMANVKLQLPPGIKAGEKYPMIVRVYAGPGTTRVKDNFDLEYYNIYLAANKSVIVASIDVRGSGVMGVEALQAVNNALGTVEIYDTLATIRSLITLYKFIDPNRVGVWGWSYGGFATTMMLIQDDQNTIACGAAVAPVTSWLYYDSIYTERYMDTPQNNPVGYKRSDLTRLAEHLRGRKYMLVHGTGDDNVHFQHSMQLAKELQHNDIEFEQMSYTDENHSLMGVSRHFYHALDHFWTRCFK